MMVEACFLDPLVLEGKGREGKGTMKRVRTAFYSYFFSLTLT
jgi:hypothetical protein